MYFQLTDVLISRPINFISTNMSSYGVEGSVNILALTAKPDMKTSTISSISNLVQSPPSLFSYFEYDIKSLITLFETLDTLPSNFTHPDKKLIDLISGSSSS